MKSLLLLPVAIVSFLLPACAKDKYAIPVPVRQPSATAPIQLVVEANKKAETAAAKVSESAATLSDSVDALQSQYDKIVKQSEADQSAKDAWVQLTFDAQRMINELKRQTVTLQNRIADLETAQRDVAPKLEAAQIAVNKKQGECDDLRVVITKNATAQKLADEKIETLESKNAKLQADADKWRTLRAWCYSIFGLFIIYIILKIVCGFYGKRLPF